MQVDDIMSKLSPALRKRLGYGSSMPEAEFAETPSVALNRALGGGFRYGRQHLVYGNKSSGKSSLMMEMIGIEQKKGKTAAWIDVEATFDASWARRLGVDVDTLIVSQAKTVNEMVDVCVELMNAGIDIVVVDSISTLLPAVFFEKNSDDLKELVDTKQIGAEARDMAHAVKMLNYANNKTNDTLLILISQTRNILTATYASIGPTGGKAVQFYSSTIVALFSSESESKAIKDDVAVGDRLISSIVGREVRWEVKFSKTSPAFQSGYYNFYFYGDSVGVDGISDMVNLADRLGVIEKSGAWYMFGDEKYQGKEKFIKGLKEREDLRNLLAEKLDEV